MTQLMARFARNDDGATAIEYGLIAAFMSVALIASFPTITSALSTTFGDIGTTMKVK